MHCRNVTVTALHGTDDVLDLQFARSKVQLCATCVWTWRNITVANERRGAGAAWVSLALSWISSQHAADSSGSQASAHELLSIRMTSELGARQTFMQLARTTGLVGSFLRSPWLQ